MNKIYENLNLIKFLEKSYHLKFLFVAFIGIHIPLISIIIFVLNNDQVSKPSIVVVSLLFTLVATALTLIILKKLLAPLIIAKKALEEYLRHRTIPVLPENYKDEAGILINLIKESVDSIHNLIQEKEQIAALLSHNLRTPFNQIKGLCEVIDTDNPSNKELIKSINLICDYQLKNVSELLNNLNNQLNNQLSITPVSIKKLIQEEADMFLTELSKKQINIKITFPEKDIVINTDKNKLTLVLQNLLTNALKFSFPGKTIHITFKEDNNKIHISVKDEGMGFPTDYENGIFDANSNLNRIGTVGEPSNGIGLKLSKKTMQLLGGDLIAKSEGENKGAEFTIII